MKIIISLLAGCLLGLLLLTQVRPAGGDALTRAHVTILSTTDLHGNIYPIDYNTNEQERRGLAKAATLVKRLRRQEPQLLLIDSGDTIQGTPLTFFHGKVNNRPRDPMMAVMNALGYDAMAVGNHEYEFGFDVLDKSRAEASFPWLSANTYRAGTDQSYFQPFVLKQVEGVRVGVLGLTTTGLPNLDNPEDFYSKVDLRDPVAEAKKWVALLRGEERVDLVIISMHMGLGKDLRTGDELPGQMSGENVAQEIAEQVPGIDVILMGHTHREVPSLYVNGVLLTQAEKWARSLARADVYLEREAGASRWRVTAKAAHTIPVGEDVEADPEITRIAEPYHRETQAWLDQVIGDSPAEMRAGEERFRDTALLDLVQRVQLEAGRANVSMAASLNPKARLAKGPVTVREIVALYEYEEGLVVLEATGRQLKEALEHSARHFGVFRPGKTLAELVDERFPGYNYDVAEGVTYDLDISRPIGQRVLNLSFHGRPLSPTQKLRLAVNKYRANGGAGYTMFRGAPVLYRSDKELRELIIEWVRRRGRVPTAPTNNWRLLPRRLVTHDMLPGGRHTHDPALNWLPHHRRGRPQLQGSGRASLDCLTHRYG